VNFSKNLNVDFKFKVGQSFEFEFRPRSEKAARVRYMPKTDKPKKPKAKSAKQIIVAELKVKSRSLSKQLSRVQRDLKSFGVGKKKRVPTATNA